MEALAQDNARLSGSDLTALAEETRQVIWGEFVGSGPTKSDKTWVIVRAVDSTLYEIDTDDKAVLSKISSTYKDVRTGEAPITSWSTSGPDLLVVRTSNVLSRFIARCRSD